MKLDNEYLPELIIILTSSISALLISSIKVKIFSETLDIIINLFSSKKDLFVISFKKLS